MYDHDDQGPGLEDVTFYMPPDQSRDQEDKATHMLAETKYRPTGTMDMEYFSGMEPVDTFEPVDFIMDPTLDISETATPVATTIGITPKREDGSNILGPTDSHAQKALASALASKRSQDIRKSKGKCASKKPKAPRKDPVKRRVDKSTLLGRNKPIREDSSPGDSVATDSKDEDCQTDSQDDDNAATILRNMKSRGYVLQKETALSPEPRTPKPPASSQPTQSQPLISCPNCPKTCRRPSEMAYVLPHPRSHLPSLTPTQKTHEAALPPIPMHLPSVYQDLWQQERLAPARELTTPALRVVALSPHLRHQHIHSPTNQYPRNQTRKSRPRPQIVQTYLLPPRRIQIAPLTHAPNPHPGPPCQRLQRAHPRPQPVLLLLRLLRRLHRASRLGIALRPPRCTFLWTGDQASGDGSMGGGGPRCRR